MKPYGSFSIDFTKLWLRPPVFNFSNRFAKSLQKARHLESFYLQSTAGFELHAEKFPMLFLKQKKISFKGLITVVCKRVALTFEAEIALGLSLSMTVSILEDYF